MCARAFLIKNFCEYMLKILSYSPRKGTSVVIVLFVDDGSKVHVMLNVV